ncbi:MAG: response regulator [Lentisphaerae bacterium]|nr:response regulator [Lentisphaerota bacterium]
MKEDPIRILFVDDSPYVLEGIGRMLSGMAGDWEIQYADSGEMAMALFSEAPFDIVATDLQMPGMNGVMLIERILDARPGTRFVVLCGDSETAEAVALASQGYPVIEKPCDGHEIQSTIETEIRQIHQSTTQKGPGND